MIEALEQGDFYISCGPEITDVTFDLDKIIEKTKDDPEAFFYITVTAPDGSYATTRPYYLKELL